MQNNNLIVICSKNAAKNEAVKNVTDINYGNRINQQKIVNIVCAHFYAKNERSQCLLQSNMGVLLLSHIQVFVTP